MVKIIDTKASSAEDNMQKDAHFLEDLKELSILHFYDWKNDSATYGHFTKIENFIDLEKAKNKPLDLAKRPTGGGIIFHIWDFAFSVLVSKDHPKFSFNPLENYKLINSIVVKAISEFLDLEYEIIKDDTNYSNSSFKRFCMARPTKYDILFNDKKIVGAAQRKTKKGFLHQGSISLMMPDKNYLYDVLKKDIADQIIKTTFPLMKTESNKKLLKEVRIQIKHLLQKYFQKELAIS